MGRKFGGGSAPPPFEEGRAGSSSNTKSPEPGPTSIPSDIFIHAAIRPQQIWAENWGLCPFRGGGAGSPPNTMWPRPRPTCKPSFILISPTVWPQCTNVTDRTGQTGQTGQDRQRTDSTGRTVLQTVAQKSVKICQNYTQYKGGNFFKTQCMYIFAMWFFFFYLSFSSP